MASSLGLLAAERGIPVIDTHIHLFDTGRPQGVPWPPKDSPIYKTALPERYRKLAMPHGVVGAIEIECSPWFDDNQWVLDIAEKDSIMVGTIGNIEPGKPEFAKRLEQLHKNRLFRGIRCGNLWDWDLGKQVHNAAVLSDLKLLAEAQLVMDTANPDGPLMRAILRLTDAVPNLTIVLDHLPELETPDARDLQALAERPNVFGKISGIVRRVDGKVPLELSFYRDRLDLLWGIFGADKLMYGSDWPNSDLWAGYADVFRLAHEFITQKDRATQEKFYWRNSVKAYRWVKRDSEQPG